MHPVQEHINIYIQGIDCSIQRLTEYINEYESNSFPTKNVTITLGQHKSTPAQQKPRQKKMGVLFFRENMKNLISTEVI